MITMAKITIRPARAEDALAIATIHVKTWQHAYQGQIPDHYLSSLSIDTRTKTWQGWLTNPRPDTQVFVAEIDSKVAGFCGVGKSREADADETSGELYAIYVDSQRMNQGLGSALIEAGVAWLKHEGFKVATLWVLDSNHKARRFYERKGWAPDGKTRTETITDFTLQEVRYAAVLPGNPGNCSGPC